jgi:hypothetical protein
VQGAMVDAAAVLLDLLLPGLLLLLMMPTRAID